MADLDRLTEVIEPEAQALGFELVRVKMMPSEAGDGGEALQLRDPRNLSSDARARACRFGRTMWLSCRGHVSTALEDEAETVWTRSNRSWWRMRTYM